MAQLASISNRLQDDPLSTSTLATYLKAVADPLRLEILRILSHDSFGVLELSRAFNTTQPGMSHHLKVLSTAGLLASRREGNSIYYRRTHLNDDDPISVLQNALFSHLDSVPLRPELEERLKETRRQRSQASQKFFTSNSDKFRQQQDLIASHEVYAEPVKDFLLALTFENTNSALEIGPGQGEFLQLLSLHFKQIYAIDNSSNMLQQAQQLAAAKNLQNIEFIEGDASASLSKHIEVDCVIINMVLHHTPSPADMFQHVSTVLNAGGHLVITDLCRHNQQWATESCGDLWLGFDPEELSQWAHDANLNEGKNSYIALRNGFQIQIRHFFKSAIDKNLLLNS